LVLPREVYLCREREVEEVQVGGTVVFFPADLEDVFFLSSSGTDRGAALGVLGG
jgi:hypothetical protein